MTQKTAQPVLTAGTKALGQRLLDEERVFVGRATIKRGKAGQSIEIAWFLNKRIAKARRGRLVLRPEGKEVLERALAQQNSETAPSAD